MRHDVPMPLCAAAPSTTCVCAAHALGLGRQIERQMMERRGAHEPTRVRALAPCVRGRRQGAVRGADEVPNHAQGDDPASPGDPAAHAGDAHGSRDNKQSGRRAVRLRRIVRLLFVFPPPQKVFFVGCTCHGEGIWCGERRIRMFFLAQKRFNLFRNTSWPAFSSPEEQKFFDTLFAPRCCVLRRDAR